MVRWFFYFIFVFFFKQKTAYEMRISDWSSDVCSSDLRGRIAALGPRRRVGAGGPDATLRAQAFDRIGAGVHGLDPPAWDAAFGDQHRLAGLDRGPHLGGLVVQLRLAGGLHGVNVLPMSQTDGPPGGKGGGRKS